MTSLRTAARLTWMAAALLLGSCGDPTNAILEMEITLPSVESDAPRRFAFTQVRQEEGFPFDATWLASDDVTAVELNGSTQLDQISVVTESVDINVHVRIRFCVSADCSQLTDASAPELRFVLEHPFYLGERTRWKQTVTEVPTTTDDPEMVGRCAIRGCVQGPDAVSYCRGDGSHLCEGT